MGKSWSRREPSASHAQRGSRFDLFRKPGGDELETAWTFQLPRSDFVAGSYEGRRFLDPPNHLGEDSAHRHHDEVRAIAHGIVRVAGRASGYGRVVVLEHLLPDGLRVCSIYGHLCGHSGYPLIRQGEVVRAGEVVGYIGDDSENGDGREHLHLGIRKGAYDGNYCGYARQPECTPRHYEAPTSFIERRSGRMVLAGGIRLASPAPVAGAEATLLATVRNDLFYGGAFEFRLRLLGGGGEPIESVVQPKRLAPKGDAMLVFEQVLPRAGRYQAVLEMKAPGVREWAEVQGEDAAPKTSGFVALMATDAG